MTRSVAKIRPIERPPAVRSASVAPSLVSHVMPSFTRGMTNFYAVAGVAQAFGHVGPRIWERVESFFVGRMPAPPSSDAIISPILHQFPCVVGWDTAVSYVIFGTLQVVAVGAATSQIFRTRKFDHDGNLVSVPLMTMPKAAIYTLLGVAPMVAQQVAAAGVGARGLDFVAMSLQTAVYTVTGMGWFKLVEIVRNRFHLPPRPYAQHLANRRVEVRSEAPTTMAGKLDRLGRLSGLAIQATFVPTHQLSLSAGLICGLLFIGYGVVVQVPHALVEGASVEESEKKELIRRLLSMGFEVPIVLGFDASSWGLVLLDSALFTAMSYFLNSAIPSYDGEALAVNSAEAVFRSAQTVEDMIIGIQSPPFIGSGVFGGSPKLAIRTWSELAYRFMQPGASPEVRSLRLADLAADSLHGSSDVAQRRLGRSLQTMVAMIASALQDSPEFLAFHAERNKQSHRVQIWGKFVVDRDAIALQFAASQRDAACIPSTDGTRIKCFDFQ